MDALVSTHWLASHLRDPDLRVADVRWYLDPSRRGRDAYDAGHIEGAIFLDVERDLAAPGGGRGRPAGRHPWPSEAQVSRVMGRAGIGPGKKVVAYDDQSGATAARLWYVLRAHGHDEVAVLDGGVTRWGAEGRPLTAAVSWPSPVRFEARLRPGFVLDKPEMARTHPDRLVLDARARERYRGETEPIDARAGHIPGARSAPYTGNLSRDGIFLAPAELRERYAALGADRQDPVVYCGSGVTACHDLLALHVAGLGGRLYAGSWSEWSLPVATGEEESPDQKR